MTHLQVGSTITAASDSFIVETTLGEGTFGAVALCRRTSSDQSVALKVMKNQQHVVFGLMETKILQMLKKYRAENQFIVRWFSAFHSGDIYCLEFEPLDISLGDFLDQSGKMSPLQIRPVLFQLSTAFKFLSNLGLIHGDLKSMNIMMVDHKTSLQVKLIDFGGAHFSSHVRSGDVTQTFWYRAPEVRLRTRYTEAIDMWSLGCVALEMISGRELFPTDNETDMLSYIVCSVGNPPDSLLRKAIHSHKSIDQTTAEGALIWTLKQYKCISLETLSLDQELDWINFVDLVLNLLSLKPETRISPAQVLDHPFITLSYITNVYNTAYVRHDVELMGSFLSRCEVQIETEEQPSSSRSEGPARILQQERPREEGNKTDRQPQESRPESRPDSSQSSTPECRPESRQWSSSEPGQWSSPEPGQWSSPEPGQWSSPEPREWSSPEPREWSRLERRQRSISNSRRRSRSGSRQSFRPQPRECSKLECRQWSRLEPKQWSRPKPREWSRPEPRQRSRSNSRQKSRSGSRQSFRPQPRECSKPECRQWSRLEPRQRSRSNSRQRSRSGSRQSFRPQPRECSKPECRQWSRLEPNQWSRPKPREWSRPEPRQRSRSNSRQKSRSGSRQSFRPQPRECSKSECRQWSRLEPRQRSRSNSRRRSRSGSRQSFRPEPKQWSTLEPRQWSRPECRQWSRPEPRQRSRQRQTLNMERPTSTTQSESRSDFRSITETTRPEKRSREEDRCGDQRCLVNKRRRFPPGPPHRSRAKGNRLVGRH